MFSKILQSYLKFWAGVYLKRSKSKVIAITGSVGKTSTKNAVFEVLKIQYGPKVRKSEGNLNNETGLPLGVLGFCRAPSYSIGAWLWVPIIFSAPFRAYFSKKVDWLVLEMAADKPGDISYLTSIVKPQIAIITTIGESHLEAFGTREKLIEEKTNLLRTLQPEGLAILNNDDEILKGYANEDKYRVVSFAINNLADVTAKNITTEINNYSPLTQLQVATNQGKFLATSQTLGKMTNIYPILIAVAVGLELKISQAQMLEGIKNIRSENHRLNTLKGKNGSVIIDDCYNASPLSMKAALDVLKTLPAKRKIAVLGDMRELGDIAKKAHMLIGEYAREICNEVLSCGEAAKDYKADKHFESKSELISYLLEETLEGDIILIKASRGPAKKIFFEEVVDALKV